MPDLRPMNFGEILDGSLVIYRRHFGLFLKLAVAALCVPAVIGVFFLARFVAEFQAHPARALLQLVLIGLVYYLATLVLTAGTIRIISDSYLGRAPRVQDALALGVSKIWPLVAVGLGKGIISVLLVLPIWLAAVIGVVSARAGGSLGIVLGIALVIGAVWLAAFVLCGYGVTTPVVVLEELGSSFDAFRRSWELTQSFKLKILGLVVVAFLLCNVIPPLVLQALGGAVMGTAPVAGIALMALAVVLPLILAPVIAAVITLVYYDLRVRREAFDLQVLGQQLGII